MTNKNIEIKIEYGKLDYREEFTRETSILYHLKNYEIFKGHKFFQDWNIHEHEFPKIITNVFDKKYDLSELEYSINLSDELYIDKDSFDGTYWMSYFIDFFSKEGLIIHSINKISGVNDKHIEKLLHTMNKNKNFDKKDNSVIIDKVFKQFSIQFI